MSIAEIQVDIYLQSVLGRLEQQYHVMAFTFGPPTSVVVTPDSASWYSPRKVPGLSRWMALNRPLRASLLGKSRAYWR
jgi:hypothetical protein